MDDEQGDQLGVQVKGVVPSGSGNEWKEKLEGMLVKVFAGPSE